MFLRRSSTNFSGSGRLDLPTSWWLPPALPGTIAVMLSALQSEIAFIRCSSHRVRLNVIELHQMPGTAAAAGVRIAIRAPSPVPDPDMPLYRRRDGPRDGCPRAPAGRPVAAGRRWVVRLGRPSTTTANLRRRRGLVRATISCSRRRRGLVRATLSRFRRRWRRCEGRTIAVGGGGLGVRCHRGGHALAGALPWFRAALWRSPGPRRLRVGRPRRRCSGWLELVHTPVPAGTRLRAVRLGRPSAATAVSPAPPAPSGPLTPLASRRRSSRARCRCRRACRSNALCNCPAPISVSVPSSSCCFTSG